MHNDDWWCILRCISYFTAVRQPHVFGINAHSTFRKANTFIDCQTIAVGRLVTTATVESERQFTKGLTTWILPSNDPTDEIWPLRSACCISSCHQKLAWQGQTHSYFHTSMKGVQSHNFISMIRWVCGISVCEAVCNPPMPWPADQHFFVAALLRADHARKVAMLNPKGLTQRWHRSENCRFDTTEKGNPQKRECDTRGLVVSQADPRLVLHLQRSAACSLPSAYLSLWQRILVVW